MRERGFSSALEVIISCLLILRWQIPWMEKLIGFCEVGKLADVVILDRKSLQNLKVSVWYRRAYVG